MPMQSSQPSTSTSMSATATRSGQDKARATFRPSSPAAEALSSSLTLIGREGTSDATWTPYSAPPPRS